jgi:hypothetical protein
MKAKTVILTIILFSLIVAGMFIYTRLKTAELSKQASFSSPALAYLYYEV